MEIGEKIKIARTEMGLTLKGDYVMMEKIEKDMMLMKAEKKVVRYGLFSVAIGVIILVLGEIFEGNPVIDFLSGATPWVLLGLAFLAAILYLDKQKN